MNNSDSIATRARPVSGFDRRSASESHSGLNAEEIESMHRLDFSTEADTLDPNGNSDQRYTLSEAMEMESSGPRWIFYWLAGILGMTLFLIFTLVRAGVVAVTEVKELGILLSPLVTLVAAAMGFYFGTVARVDRR